LDDLEALLNARFIVEGSPSVNEVVADDYYVDFSDWKNLFNNTARIDDGLNYYWDGKATHNSWVQAYKNPIYYSNVVLDVAAEINTEDQVRLNKIKGSALFYRSFAFDRLSEVYCKPYAPTANKDLGLVLITTSDINQPSKRSSVQETYDQILKDLKRAADLLPHHSEFPTHPTKAAAYGTLARVYLSMRDYENAGYFADLCLKVNGILMDYNKINASQRPIFKEYNPEVIFHNRPNGTGILSASIAKINPELYNSYDDGDLRKNLFFLENTGKDLGTYRFRGSYLGRFNTAGNDVFDGITSGEMYLIRAESFARSGDKESALKDLNTLLVKRYINDGSWVPVTAQNSSEVLNRIFIERRKELVFRGLRWSDLRRLNEEGNNLTLTRVLDGVVYNLPPGDLRWTLLITEIVTNRSGSVEQNPR
jgi:hypothetical protein